jgi:hypothetical protein
MGDDLRYGSRLHRDMISVAILSPARLPQDL